ncbi:response regulator transcription factor [Comamonas sp. C24C]
MNHRLKIALLEDDLVQADLVSRWLGEAGHEVIVFQSSREIIKNLMISKYDLLLLDWELPDFSGIDVLAWARLKHHRDTPAIILTMRSSGHHAAEALNAGANDFVRKPADREELLARIEAATARKENSKRLAITIGLFKLDRNGSTAYRDGVEIQLTSIQFSLAWHLFQNVGHVVSREQLRIAVWGRAEGADSRTMDTHISNLRSRLGLRPDHGLKVSALYNYGYRLEICQLRKHV